MKLWWRRAQHLFGLRCEYLVGLYPASDIRSMYEKKCVYCGWHFDFYRDI